MRGARGSPDRPGPGAGTSRQTQRGKPGEQGEAPFATKLRTLMRLGLLSISFGKCSRRGGAFHREGHPDWDLDIKLLELSGRGLLQDPDPRMILVEASLGRSDQTECEITDRPDKYRSPNAHRNLEP